MGSSETAKFDIHDHVAVDIVIPELQRRGYIILRDEDDRD